MTVTLTTEITAAAGDSSYAILDPLITIDLSTPDAQAYQILLSPSVVNIGPAEAAVSRDLPPTWALPVLTLALLFLASQLMFGMGAAHQ